MPVAVGVHFTSHSGCREGNRKLPLAKLSLNSAAWSISTAVSLPSPDCSSVKNHANTAACHEISNWPKI